MRRKPSLAFLLLTAATLSFLVVHYGHVLRDPFGVMLSDGGDGLKNVFTFAWYVAHDNGTLLFTGANHPFGEHVFFTDGHPLLAWLLRLTGMSGGAAVGLLNLLLIGGMLLGAWCYHLLFRHFGLPPWASALGALGLMALQPQVFRLGSHLSLAHAWPIPLAWWLTLKATSPHHPWRWALAATALTTATYLIHPYLGLMIGFFQGAFLTFLLVLRWPERRRQWGHHARSLTLVLLPLLVLALLFAMGPQVSDRPREPAGSDLYATRVMSLLLPTHPPFSTPLNELIRYDALEWETWCYLGLTTIILLVALGVAWLKSWAVDCARAGRMDDLSISLAASFVVLLFAMGAMTDTLQEWLPMLKQFRGLGRFAWVFWNVAGVVTLTRAYHLLLPVGAVRSRGIPLYVVLAAFPVVEGWAQHAFTGAQIGRQANVFRDQEGSEAFQGLVEKARRSGASGLIPLPLPHAGSEHYQRNAHPEVMGRLIPLAYHAHLSLVAGILSRTSLSQTRAMFSLLAPTPFSKAAMRNALSDQDTLLLANVGAPLDEHEQALWERGHPYDSADGIELRVITGAELLADNAMQELERYRRGASAWTKHHGTRLTNTIDEAAPVDTARVVHAWTTDTLFGVSNASTILVEVPAGTLDPEIDHEIGFPFRSIDPQAININLLLISFTPDGRENEWERVVGVRGMPMQWPSTTFVTLRFRPKHIHRNYSIVLSGPPFNTGRFAVEHLYIRPVNVDLWREVEVEARQVVLRNNVPLIAATP